MKLKRGRKKRVRKPMFLHFFLITGVICALSVNHRGIICNLPGPKIAMDSSSSLNSAAPTSARGYSPVFHHVVRPPQDPTLGLKVDEVELRSFRTEEGKPLVFNVVQGAKQSRC